MTSLASLGISPVEAALLDCLRGTRGRLTITNRPASAIEQLLAAAQALARKGVVEVEASLKDRRHSHLKLVLTPAAMAAFDVE